MELFGLSRTDILNNSVIKDNYYAMTMGEQVEVTALRKRNSNNILIQSLSKKQSEDKFMVKYIPNNVVYFDKELIDSEIPLKYVSCKIDRKSCCVFVGRPEKYQISSGVLATTGVLSLNGMVEVDRDIYYGSHLTSTSLKTKVTLLSVGLRGDSLFGLFHIPRERGIAVSVDNKTQKGVSVASMRERDCWNWGTCCVEDWFDKCKVTPDQG